MDTKHQQSKAAREKLLKLAAKIGNQQRKQNAAARIPFIGVVIRPTEVRRHRYLRDHGLPQSATVAAVSIE